MQFFLGDLLRFGMFTLYRAILVAAYVLLHWVPPRILTPSLSEGSAWTVFNAKARCSLLQVIRLARLVHHSTQAGKVVQHPILSAMLVVASPTARASWMTFSRPAKTRLQPVIGLGVVGLPQMLNFLALLMPAQKMSQVNQDPFAAGNGAHAQNHSTPSPTTGTPSKVQSQSPKQLDYTKLPGKLDANLDR